MRWLAQSIPVLCFDCSAAGVPYSDKQWNWNPQSRQDIPESQRHYRGDYVIAAYGAAVGGPTGVWDRKTEKLLVAFGDASCRAPEKAADECYN
jgi:hypothetical protein